MTTSKLLIALGLTLALGTLPSCKSKDTPIPTPKPAPTPTPTPTPTPDLPAKGMKIENGVLITYGADVTPADGIVRLDKDKVHTIGEKAFAGNTRLKEIHATGVTKIEAGAFKGCSSLMKVDFGAGQRPPLAIGEQDKSTYTAEDAFWGTPEEKVLTFNPKAAPNYLAYFEYIARHHFARLDGIEIPAALSASDYVVKNGVLEGKYDPKRPFTLILGAKPAVDFTPYKDDMPQDGSVTFHGMISPTLYPSPADKAGYDLKDGKWHGFTVKELK